MEDGASGILCSVPMSIIEDDAEVKAYFVQIANAGMPMLIVQDLHWNGDGMSLDVHLDL